MEISDQLRCLFSGRVDEADGSYVIEVPKQELELGNVEPNQTYRVALVPAPDAGDSSGHSDSTEATRRSGADKHSQNGQKVAETSAADADDTDPTSEDDAGEAESTDSDPTAESAPAERSAGDAAGSDRRHNGNRGRQRPPVEEGETRRVEIQDLGDQGDGITRVERGFVVIVPDTDQGERVEIEITDVRENVAFGDVVERLSYYE